MANDHPSFDLPRSTPPELREQAQRELVEQVAACARERARRELEDLIAGHDRERATGSAGAAEEDLARSAQTLTLDFRMPRRGK